VISWLSHRIVNLETAGERARRLHARWLTRAFTDPNFRQPRIPVRPVALGGFSRLTATARGRAWADAWWESALSCPDPA